jgi:hypothetical protein
MSPGIKHTDKTVTGPGHLQGWPKPPGLIFCASGHMDKRHDVCAEYARPLCRFDPFVQFVVDITPN